MHGAPSPIIEPTSTCVGFTTMTAISTLRNLQLERIEGTAKMHAVIRKAGSAVLTDYWVEPL